MSDFVRPHGWQPTRLFCPWDSPGKNTGVQRKADQHIRYELVESSGPDHMKRFIMAVFLNDEEIGRGDGRSKKEAEQEAAKAALKAYQ